MKWFFNLFKNFGGKAQKAAQLVDAAIQKALPIVQKIVELTPNKTDDEVLEAFKHFGVPAIQFVANGSNANLLRDLAKTQLIKVFPSLSDNALNLAVEGALFIVKNS